MKNTVFLDKVRTNKTIGVPMTPAYWTGEEKFIPVTRIAMTAGGGMGGSFWYECVKCRLADIEKCAAERVPLVTKTWDGKTVALNMNFMVKAEELTVVTNTLHTENKNFATGDFQYAWLFPKGTNNIAFLDEYENLND